MGQSFSHIQLKNNQSNININDLNNYSKYMKFQQIIDDPNFGLIQIFRNKQEPFNYILNYKNVYTTIEEAQNRLKHLQYIQQLVNNNRNKNNTQQNTNNALLKIHHIHLQKEKNLCIEAFSVQTFVTYYNFTLQKTLQKKIAQKLHFNLQQLIYIFNTLVQLEAYLKTKSLALQNINTTKIFLTPEGHIKLYPLQFHQNHSHSVYFKALQSQNQRKNILLSPEQIQYLKMLQFNIKYDVYKSDLFSIALLVLSLIFQQDPISLYYKEKQSRNNLSQLSINTGRIEFDLASLNKKNYFSESEAYKDFVQLLKLCLQKDYKKRITLQQAVSHINLILNKYSYNQKNMRIILVNDSKKQENTDGNHQQQNKIIQNNQKVLNNVQNYSKNSIIQKPNQMEFTNTSNRNSINYTSNLSYYLGHEKNMQDKNKSKNIMSNLYIQKALKTNSQNHKVNLSSYRGHLNHQNQHMKQAINTNVTKNNPFIIQNKNQNQNYRNSLWDQQNKKH